MISLLAIRTKRMDASLAGLVAVILSACAETTQLTGADRIAWEQCNKHDYQDLGPITRARACEERIAAEPGRAPPRTTSIMDAPYPTPAPVAAIRATEQSGPS